MTEHKHRKQRVRDRMARTGETYSTARRHVVAGPIGGRHHESTLLARLLAGSGYRAPHTGQPYTEAMACGLGGGIGFMYALFAYRGMPKILSIVAQHHPQPWVPAALDRLGIGYAQERGAIRPALAALDRALAAGRPVYCSIASAFPTEPRTVLVLGRTGDGCLVDGGGPTPAGMAEAEFAAAWSGYKKGRHHRIVLDPPEDRPVDLTAAVRAAVATTVAHLTGPVLGNSFDVNFGFSGMRRLAAWLRDPKESRPSAEAFGFTMRRLYQGLTSENTSAGGTRPLYAEFLDEAADLLADGRLGEAADLFRASGRTWAEIADRALGGTEGFGEVAELVQRRAMVRLTQGDEAELTARIQAAGPVTLPDVAALRAGLADLVDRARETEERAVPLLAR
jgi:Domain of unknown function (DUF4872)/Butirosin biosynthesis protein H, N-terminal